MKKIVIGLLFIGTVIKASVTIDAKNTKKMGIVIATTGTETTDMQEVAATLQNDLAFTGQFNPSVVHIPHLSSKKELGQYKEKGPLFLSLIDAPKDKQIEWRLYDTRTLKMLSGKGFKKNGKLARGWGHALADRVIEQLTGNKGCCSSKLVYCKEQPHAKETLVCMADYDGRHEQIVSKPGSLAIAPRWNNDVLNPVVLYSEYTSSNIRLMATDLKGNKQVATSFDGLNMLPAFSPDGSRVIVCLSVEGSSQIYAYHYNKRKRKPEYIRLTHNSGNNISPTILDNEDIVFCSDYELGRPQIYKMNSKGKNIKRISNGGSCSSPTYSPVKNKIAYSKVINGISQIMTYDLETEFTTQETNDPVHKEEASWSPCGNYLVYSVNNGKTKRLATHNFLTKERTYLTSGKYRYSYPSWSPYYQFFPAHG